MASFLDGIVLLLVSTGYFAFVNSMNILATAKFLLYLPLPIFLVIFLIYAINHKTNDYGF